jgi:hypothetical protein
MVRRGWLGVCVVFARAWSLRGMWVPGEHMHVLGASARVEPQAAGHIYDHQGGVYMWHGHLIRPASSAASFHPPQLGVPGASAGKCTVRGDDRLAYRTFCCENSSLELLPSLNQKRVMWSSG